MENKEAEEKIYFHKHMSLRLAYQKGTVRIHGIYDKIFFWRSNLRVYLVQIQEIIYISSLKKTQTSHIRIINLFPSCYGCAFS